jgi:hypothetical protein
MQVLLGSTRGYKGREQVSELNITELLNQKVLEFGNERFLEGWNGQQERIIKLIWDNAEAITNQYFYHNALIGEPTAFLIALIKGENK